MLPLRPPASTTAPGYPERHRLLGDPDLRRHALRILAIPAIATVLAACAPRLSGRPPAPQPPGTGQTPGSDAADPTVREGLLRTITLPEPASPR